MNFTQKRTGDFRVKRAQVGKPETWLWVRDSKPRMTPGYSSLPRTGGFDAVFALGVGLKWKSHIPAPSQVQFGWEPDYWGEGGGKSGHVGKCRNACVGPVEEHEGGYAVASRC